MGSTPPPSSKSEDSSITPPEAWGGEKLTDKYTYPNQPVNLPSRLGMLSSAGQTAGSMLSGMQDTPSSTGTIYYTSSGVSYANLRAKDASASQETSSGFTDHTFSTSLPLSINTKTSLGQANTDSPRILDSPRMSFPRRSTYAERISTTSTFSDGVSLSVGSPKIKKSGAETKEDLLNSLLLKSDISALAESGSLPLTNVCYILQFILDLIIELHVVVFAFRREYSIFIELPCMGFIDIDCVSFGDIQIANYLLNIYCNNLSIHIFLVFLCY